MTPASSQDDQAGTTAAGDYFRRGRSGIGRRKGFTLIELLVVVAIIALLGTVSLGAYINAINAAHSTACMANLRQIGVLMISYANDNNEQLPTGWNASTGTTYAMALLPYMDGQTESSAKNVFVCPGSLLPMQNRGPTASYNITYAMHDYLGSGTERLLAVKNPDQTILVADAPQNPSNYNSSASTLYNPGEFTYVHVPPYISMNTLLPTSLDADTAADQGNIRYRHNSSTNVLFVDGHVENAKKGTLTYANIYPTY
jgi:prepilin-type N-terminal cleavage/methylation domain-containing protein/prepilin-type processing-associated H-X9-DG protein